MKERIRQLNDRYAIRYKANPFGSNIERFEHDLALNTVPANQREEDLRRKIEHYYNTCVANKQTKTFREIPFMNKRKLKQIKDSSNSELEVHSRHLETLNSSKNNQTKGPNDDLKSELIQQSSAGKFTEGNYYGTLLDPTFSGYKDFGATLEQLMASRKLQAVVKKTKQPVRFRDANDRVEASN